MRTQAANFLGRPFVPSSEQAALSGYIVEVLLGQVPGGVQVHPEDTVDFE